ncbi:CDP-glycerol glycerophosphotransferase family protein [Streptomyces sp. NPDC006879]|uniref:bifunctional glycosyltransferase/CDP-glycerol:glycerophosphate glycerophosphotransferase n=1 Tax=Streptomyces sp. NPDC006879 TaxID=3364767 RepID=UPI003678EBE2
MKSSQAASRSHTPRFSIIVPTYKVEAYLRDCLDSVLEQSFEDYELIVVNDCSPDGCAEIINEYAAADRRVLPLHLEQNVGLGRARNEGMARATGEYLLFLDSDDSFLPGSLQAIAQSIDEAENPDLVVFDYVRTHWDGRITANSRADVLADAPAGAFTLDEHPGLLDLLQVAWNKAYRREFIEEWGFLFPPGYYEDTPWTYPVLIAAARISVLNRVCVYYRQRRQGSILHSTSRKHFDIFEQYERVFTFLTENPQFDQWRSLLYDRMMTHFRVVESSPGRLPADARAEFRARRLEDERLYRPADYVEAPQAKVPLVRRGARRLPGPLLGAARRAYSAARGTRSSAGKLKKVTRKAVLETYYRAQCALPVEKDLAVFAAYWDTDYSCNPAAVHEKLLELAPEMRTVWVLRPGARRRPPAGTEVVHPGSFGFWRAMARGAFFVNNVNFPDRVVKRPGQVYLQTHHGTPLKRMGVDLAEFPAARRTMSLRRLMKRVDRWDYSLSSNSFSTAVWERAYPAEFTSLEYGYPRNDALVNATPEQTRAARESLGIPEDSTVVLYAPTHRDYRQSPQPMLDLELLAQSLGSGFTVLSRTHYFYLNAALPAAQSGSARIVDVSRHPRVEELYLAADCLLTDYSSLMFDYALLDRPIVIFANDWETYQAARGTYFDIHVESPGPVVATESDLSNVFLSGRWSDDDSAKSRATFRKRFCEFDDGFAAERVVRKVFLEQDGIPPVGTSTERQLPRGQN